MKRNYSKGLIFVSALVLPLLLCAGGKPSKGTSKDMRLAANKPKTATPAPPAKPMPKKGGK